MSIAEKTEATPRPPVSPKRLSKLAATYLMARRAYRDLRRRLNEVGADESADDVKAVVYSARHGMTATEAVLSFMMDKQSAYMTWDPVTGDPFVLIAGDDPAMRVIPCELLAPLEPSGRRGRRP